MDCLNLGCGSHFHPDWVNVDFVSTGEGVIAHNLRQGLPFADESFDVVYHSHVLEHFPKDEVPFFLSECWRVLRPEGILRVVIPDLEQIARLYLTALEHALAGSTEWADHYNWLVLEMYDQVVRERSGGSLATYLAQNPLPNQSFVLSRIGKEAETLITYLQTHPEHFQSSEPALSEREATLKRLLGDRDYTALQIGRFRQSGEVHQWMYDRYSLRVLLQTTGFDGIHLCQADESSIPEFATFGLDVLPTGQVRKPDSLFMEARKQRQGNQPEHQVAPSSPEQAPLNLEDLPQVQALQQSIQQLKGQTQHQDQVLSQLASDLEAARQHIAAMESSKFWKVRSRWIQLKQRLGLKE